MPLVKTIVYTILTSIFIISCSADRKPSADIAYTLQAKLKDSIPVLEVVFDYKSDSSGIITLHYENNSWGDNDIFNCIHSFDVSPKPYNISFLKDSSKIVVKAKPNSNYTVRYQIVQDYKGPPLNQKRYRPMIDSTYFHILGMRLFMIPEQVFETDTSEAKIKIQYQNDLDDDLFHSSYGKDSIQNIEVIREDLYASFFVGGDFRRYSFTHDEDTIYFVTRGKWKSFEDEDIFNILEQSIYSQRDFWKDPRRVNFSVSLVPTYESWYSVGGSGFSSSFISFASNNDQVTLSQMKWLYNHELLHKWIGRTILNENEVEQYWFSEGFTDYYAYKLLLKNNGLTLTEYIDILNNEVLIPHYQDPVNSIPNAQLTFQEYWSNYAKYQKLPYRRGLLYAFYIDNQIKEQSNYTKSLDNLMHDLFKKALDDNSMRLNTSLFISTLSNYIDPATAVSDFTKYIVEGELIDFENRLPEGLSITIQNNIPIFILDSESLVELNPNLKL